MPPPSLLGFGSLMFRTPGLERAFSLHHNKRNEKVRCSTAACPCWGRRCATVLLPGMQHALQRARQGSPPLRTRRRPAGHLPAPGTLQADMLALGAVLASLLWALAVQARAAWPAGTAALMLFTPYFFDARL